MSSKLYLLALAGVLAAGTALADPPSWAPAHGYREKQREHYQEQQREQHYVYYRDYSTPIYYSPERRLWFWYSGGGWQVGMSLPTMYRAYVGTGGVTISLDTARPYEREDYVIQHYGAPRGHHERREHHHFHHHEHDDD